MTNQTTPNENSGEVIKDPKKRKAIYTTLAALAAILLALNIITADQAAELADEDRIDNIASIVIIFMGLLARKNTPV